MFAAKEYINTNIDEQLNIPNNDPSEAVKSAIACYIPTTSEISANLNFGEIIFLTTAVTFHNSGLVQLPHNKLQTAVANVCYILKNKNGYQPCFWRKIELRFPKLIFNSIDIRTFYYCDDSDLK